MTINNRKHNQFKRNGELEHRERASMGRDSVKGGMNQCVLIILSSLVDKQTRDGIVTSYYVRNGLPLFLSRTFSTVFSHRDRFRCEAEFAKVVHDLIQGLSLCRLDGVVIKRVLN